MTFRRGRDDRGAAAVEFALVVPVLLMVMLGILDYGMWFSDSLNLRQGARTPAVPSSTTSRCRRGAPARPGWRSWRATPGLQIGAVGGTSYARVAIFNPDGTSSTDWKKGQQLLVCDVVEGRR